MPNQELTKDWYTRFEFDLGVASIKQLPDDNGKEVAFAGRSNVGKSSVINKITSRRNLARTSKLPGRTRELNYFSINENRRIVDLPGYGFARVDVATKNKWRKLLDFYFQERQSLRGVFLIIDIRHPLKSFDQLMFNYCQTNDLSLHMVLNKSDKISKNMANKTINQIKSDIKSPNTSIQLFSSLKGIGVDEARIKLAEWLF
ncbi:MAG: YihA family ribosome biogenesis GTP-binding protein [Legionellales bacterium]|nr:YihA family ribosome biogenesis GTP-binding protein [Legionellales bacterium]